MILSASRRTDIPCYYADWLMNRLRAGYVLVRNPMNRAQVSRVSLSPQTVDCIVFWTKDAENMLPHLAELDALGYRYYFQFTLTPYGRALEPGLRDKRAIEDTFIRLSRRVGRERVVWRYDPIVLNAALDVPWHEKQFARLCDKLAAYTDTVTVSFVDEYRKLKTNLIRAITAEEIARLSAYIGATAETHGLRAVACCEKADLTPYGIRRASCIDKARLEAVCGCGLDVKPDPSQRPGCGCVESVDIGAYDTCPGGCVYCYANDPATIGRRTPHDPNSPLLNGTLADTDRVTERKVKSHRRNQLTFADFS